MDFAVVDVEIERAVPAQHAARLDQARFEESQIIVVYVAVRPGRKFRRAVAVSAEPGAVAVLALHRS